tara:strand:+ start:33927 stop:35741 length:1815 start_codon:yes stop_codon:yes gene_type:complete
MTTKIHLISIGLLVFGHANAQSNIHSEVTHVQGTFLGITNPISEYSGSFNGTEKSHSEGDVKENRKRPEVLNLEATNEIDPVVQETFGTTASKAPIVNFNGLFGGLPPDPTGAAGPNHYVQAVNSSYRVYGKSGSPLSGSLPLNSLWAGSTNDGDPIVLYDKHAGRWVITQFQSTGNKILFAVSTSPDPLGTYATYSYGLSSFPDYPKYSIWSDGYYMTANSNNQNAIVFDRAAMLAGSSTASYIALTTPAFITQLGFKSILPADADGTLPPFGTPNYMFYFQDNAWSSSITSDVIKILKFQVNWSSPNSSSISLHQTLYPSAFSAVFANDFSDIQQKGTTQKIDAQASIFNYRAQYIRWGTYNTVMLCNVVDVNNADKGGIRWYELRQDNATNQFSIFQEGTYAPDDDSRFIGSIAMDLCGNIGLAYSISGPNSYPSLGYTGRRYFDPLGQMTVQEVRAVEGSFYQSGFNRFGDYSQMTLDPDGLSFWFTGEYIGSGGVRSSRIFSFDMVSLVSTPQNKMDNTNLLTFQKGEVLNIRMEGLDFTDKIKVELLEMNGKTVRAIELKIENGKLQLAWDISSIAKGTYIVAVGGNDFQRTQKIILQ